MRMTEVSKKQLFSVTRWRPPKGGLFGGEKHEICNEKGNRVFYYTGDSRLCPVQYQRNPSRCRAAGEGIAGGRSFQGLGGV